MRFFYLDPGMHEEVGHHANYCRYIVGELRRRGIKTLVFAHQQVPLLTGGHGISLTPERHFRSGSDSAVATTSTFRRVNPR